MRYLVVLFFLLSACGTSTSIVAVNYQPSLDQGANLKSVTVSNVEYALANRLSDSGIGVMNEAFTTEPIAVIVRRAIISELNSTGTLVSDGQNYVISATVDEVDSAYYPSGSVITVQISFLLLHQGESVLSEVVKSTPITIKHRGAVSLASGLESAIRETISIFFVAVRTRV